MIKEVSLCIVNAKKLLEIFGGMKMAKGQVKQKQVTINKNQFEELCAIQCTQEEIAAVFNVSRDTLMRWCLNTYNTNFATIYEEKRAKGKASLRRSQFNLAKTNPTLSVWLGKQYLGQTDRVDIAVKEEDDDPITKAIKESLNEKQTD